VSEPLVPREDARATLEARRELGPELEPQLVDAFVERVERRLQERLRTTPRRYGGTDWGAVILSVCSLLFAIPLIAIPAGTLDGFAAAVGIVAVCGVLFMVNALYYEHRK
jgi:hypothetical protein